MKDLKLKNCRLDGRYDIHDRLGRGSYAEIYVAEDILAAPQSPHKTVVIKALNVFMQNDLDADLERTLVENFQNEAVALDTVRHPNVISRLGHGTSRDLNDTVFHYLVLEYLPGGDLSRHCQNQKLSVTEALDYIEQICAGIGHAHKRRIIHRDIKPQNMLLDADRKVVKIADFGVARSAQSDLPITRVGTNIYAPPEHSPMLAGQTGTLTSNEITPASDIYSLAKAAYVLLTSESPRFFANHPITELPHSFEQPWVEELVKVLNKATLSDSRKRYQDVNEFWNDLSGLRIVANPVSSEILTHISSHKNTAPQPQFAKGYTPNAPIKPKFNTSRELQLKPHLTVGPKPPLVEEIDNNSPLAERKPHMELADDVASQPIKVPSSQSIPKKKIRRVAAVFILLIGLFAGSLYGTYNYLLGVFPEFRSPFSKQVGTAMTDINLRSSPTTNNSPIGLVTRNSRVRVVNVANNWYEIVIIEHGRPKTSRDQADRGWAYGRYIRLDE